MEAAGDPPSRFLADAQARLTLDQIGAASYLDTPLGELCGASVLIDTRRQLSAALALIELDGLVRRMVLCLPDLPAEHVRDLAAIAEVRFAITDAAAPHPMLPGLRVVGCDPLRRRPVSARGEWRATEWVLLTSGTTGRPKMVVHTLASLADAIASGGAAGRGAVWATFYDIRRYGGLQVLLRALISGASLVLSDGEEAAGAFLGRAASNGVTHISGTPSHWRRALMTGRAHEIEPRYVRLSGEIADQAILDKLRAFFPEAEVGHAFATTEAGVAFDVRDGHAGFDAGLVGQDGGAVDMRVKDHTLRIRSARTATRYLGDGAPSLRDESGFVDTGDVVELHGDRYSFAGRREGIINVGGQKVHPEEVEAIINRHPSVLLSLVTGLRSPITGAIVAAEVMTKTSDGGADAERISREVVALCRGALAPYKVPARVRIVSSLPVSASGKLARARA